MNYHNKLVTIINAQAEMLKELNGEILHSKLASFTNDIVAEFKESGLNLTEDAKIALFKVENIHTITVK